MESCAQKTDTMNNNPNLNPLNEEEKRVIIHKGTEMPFSGEYYMKTDSGVYICKQCNSPLYQSQDKFHSGCGWPSFDDAIPGAVKETTDADGRRTEITCAKCGGHLGHVFRGEGFTDKNTRHCVNSISLNFQSATANDSTAKYDTAIFAGGCFWGVEYYLQQVDGVISAESGYTGGHIKNPGYKEVCTGRTGHAEAVRVIFDSTKTSFETLAKVFFETHDPTQSDGQGPDLGNQYRSAVFYLNDEQKNITEKLIGMLKSKGFNVVTEVNKADVFYPAESYHQEYYFKTGKTPYCHAYIKRF